MRAPHFHARPGVTFIEVLLFVGIISIVSVIILPLLFSSTENRLLQETISIVEGNGNQILQKLSQEIRHSEKILDPPAQTTRTVLLLQTGSGTTNPTLFGVSSGSFISVHHDQKTTLTSSQVYMSDFQVRNTSVSTSRQSVYVKFKLTRTIRLEAPHEYSKQFEALFNVYPDDVLTGGACSCAAPGCAAADSYVWQIYDVVGGLCSCSTKQTYVLCQ